LPPTPPEQEAAGLRLRLAAITGMGFASGLPYLLTGQTLAIWATESGISLGQIGALSLVGLSYSLKFLWAPVIDRVPVPVLSPWLGHRRGWAVLLQLGLIAAIAGLATTDPALDLGRMVLWAVLVAFLSASQDIVIDALRIELLKSAEQGPGAAATQIGYRLGLIAAGAGTLYAASEWGWHVAYGIMAALVLIGLLAVLLTHEPPPAAPPPEDWFRSAVVAPFAEFLQRPEWGWILAIVVLFNLGASLAGYFAGPFYLSLGFTKVEYAGVSKIFGVIATMAGLSLYGVVARRLDALRALLLTGILQTAANLTYIIQGWAGHDIRMLAVTIAFENVALGMAGAALVAYLSQLCSRRYTATQYALLSALASVAIRLIGSGGGVVAKSLGWTPFFLICAGLSLPGLALIVHLARARDGYTE
jgi:PAT family beta-lactamase induction signal transducer AmpG